MNDIIILFFKQLGLGFTAYQKFAAMFGSDGFHLKTFQEKEKRIITPVIDNTEEVLNISAVQIKDAYLAIDPTISNDTLCITVNFDGPWQKRGHPSMHGVAAVIGVLTGLVVDYVVLSKFCHAYALKKTHLKDDNATFDE